MPDFTTPRFDHPPRPMAQRVGAILWPSFFAAGVATMAFFAFVDPLALRDMTFPDIAISRGLGYTLGFFMLWLATASSRSTLSARLLVSSATRFSRYSVA